MTADEHLEIIDLVKDMMLVDPSDLLPCHRDILRIDFQRLGEGSGIDRKLWLTKMHSAIAAAHSHPSESTQLAFSNYE